MKGVIGLLLVVVGIEIAYLVLAGKLPLQLKPATTTKGATGGGPDLRSLVNFGTIGQKGPATGLPLASWGGLT